MAFTSRRLCALQFGPRRQRVQRHGTEFRSREARANRTAAAGGYLVPGKFELKKASNGQLYFNLKSPNGQTILTSEMYKTKPSALNGIESVKKNAPVDARYGKKTSASGKPFFVLKAGNNQVIGQSEMYENEKARDAGIASVKKNAEGAKTADLTAQA